MRLSLYILLILLRARDEYKRQRRSVRTRTRARTGHYRDNCNIWGIKPVRCGAGLPGCRVASSRAADEQNPLTELTELSLVILTVWSAL